MIKFDENKIKDNIKIASLIITLALAYSLANYITM